MTDYHIWPAKVSSLQADFLIHCKKSDLSIFKRLIRNNLSSNINDNGDNNEKKAKCLKTWVGIFGGGGGGGGFSGW